MKTQFKKKLLELHEGLIKDPSLEVLNFYVAPPLSLDKLQKLGLNKELLDFYSETNGIQLSYVRKDNEDFDKAFFNKFKGDLFPWMWQNENYWHLDGCIHILPIDLIFESDWKGYIWFESQKKHYIEYKGERMPQLEFERKLKPFDVFSKSSIAVINPVGDDFEILLSTDHNASYTDFNPIRFTKYIHGVIQTKGLIEKRKDVFYIN